MFRILLVLLAILAALAGLLVGTLNPDSVELDFLVLQTSLPAGLILIGAFGAGLMAGLILAWVLFGLPGALSRMRRSGRKQPDKQPSDSRELNTGDE